MRIRPFKLTRTTDRSIELQENCLPHFYDIYHQHPEIQMTLIVESTGSLFVGDYVGRFQPGDLFIIGGSVPHVFSNDSLRYETDDAQMARSISIFFEESSLGDGFLKLPETAKIRSLFSRIKKSLRFTSAISKKIYPIVSKMFGADNIDKLIHFITILKLLSDEKEYEFLTHDLQNFEFDKAETKRLNDIVQFTLREFHREIDIRELANISNMTPTSFCRYFKQRTGKTYTDFLNETRINHACKLLHQQDISITGISDLCGFNNLSNFHRQFKKLKGTTPKMLRSQVQQHIGFSRRSDSELRIKDMRGREQK